VPYGAALRQLEEFICALGVSAQESVRGGAGAKQYGKSIERLGLGDFCVICV